MTFDLKYFAKLGAARRLQELQEEAQAIRATFPELVTPQATPPKRSPLSAKERAAISKRMKAYWEARRAGKTVKK